MPGPDAQRSAGRGSSRLAHGAHRKLLAGLRSRQHAKARLNCVDDIRERVIDARMLWDADRREGAFLLALVSVAVRAKLEHPEINGDRAKYEAFIRSRLGPRI